MDEALRAAAIVCAKYGLIVSVLALLYGLRRFLHAWELWSLVAGAATAAAITFLAGHSVHHVRPFVSLHVVPPIPHAADNGFPSDHSVAAAYIAAWLWFYDKPGALLASAAALAIGCARVYCLLHLPSDVAAGFLIGALPGIFAAAVSRRTSPRAGAADV